MYRKAKRENNFEEQNNILPVETSPPLDNISIKSSKGPPLGFGPSGTEYSLVYFGGVRNKAEPVRLILNYYGIPYEDRFVSFDEWPKLKPETPMGMLPVLYFKDGRSLCQSYTIARFLAREHGNLAGLTNLDAAKVDMLASGLYDLIVEFERLIFHGADQAEAWNEFERDYLGIFLERYSQFLENTGGDWFVGDNISWADLAVTEYLSNFREYWSSDLLTNYPLLAKLIENVQATPSIKEYIQKRGPSLMKI